MNEVTIPSRSPYSLIQEDLWPDEYAVLVSCILLNCTTRKQVDKVIGDFFKSWPTEDELARASEEDVSSVIKSLGFSSRRAKTLIKFAIKYRDRDFENIKDLPGVGEYAASAHKIFFTGKIDSEPKDHALSHYYNWRHSGNRSQ